MTTIKFISGNRLCIICLLVISILVQSCQVYRPQGSSLEEAVQSNNRVKVVGVNGGTITYRKVMVENGEFIGLQKENGEWIQTKLDQNSIKEVRLKNRTGSAFASVFTGILATIGILALMNEIYWGNG